MLKNKKGLVSLLGRKLFRPPSCMYITVFHQANCVSYLFTTFQFESVGHPHTKLSFHIQLAQRYFCKK